MSTTIINFRDVIADRMKARKINANQLAMQLAGSVSRTHLYNYLRGARRLSDNRLAAVLAALDLTITEAKEADRPTEETAGSGKKGDETL